MYMIDQSVDQSLTYTPFTETGVFAAPVSGLQQRVVRDRALVAPKPHQGVLVRGHAGLVINKLPYLSHKKTPTPLRPPWCPRHRPTVGS